MIRMSVKYRGQPLMPMKSRRVTKFIRERKGRIRYDRKLGIHYLQLLTPPSGYEVQEVSLGLDPGSTFDGISIVSKDCHHENLELIQRSKRGKTSIKTLKKRQAGARRVRRSRLRHRPIRFSNRTSKKMTPTISANVDFRKWAIGRLATIYPISRIVIEDVCFNHYKSKKGKSFSHVEQGKTELYRWVNKDLGCYLELKAGSETANARINYFGGDPKVKTDKGAKKFEAHCIDSFILACNWIEVPDDVDKETGEIKTYQIQVTNNVGTVKKTMNFIEKIVKVRRRLTMTRKRFKQKALYYKQSKGGVKVPYTNISNKRNLCRVKPDDEHSNHPKIWSWIDNGFAERFKHFSQGYGGTVIKGVKKFWIGGEWRNRELMRYVLK